MENATRQKLAQVAEQKALLPFHGYLEGQEPNIEPIVRLFPGWNLREADRLWCAAFVYYCCLEAGFVIPCRPDECVTCNLAGCPGWEEYAIGDSRIAYSRGDPLFASEPGDIVLYDRVFINQEHDHIGIVLGVENDILIAAEGNISDQNMSGIVRRPMDEHIRAYIRIPDGYRYNDPQTP